MTVAASPRPVEPLVVLANVEAAAEQRLLVVDGGPGAADYTAAGQVVEAEAGGARAYLVIASPPRERPRLTFLVRTGRGAVGDRLAQATAGETVSMTRPFGPGFRVERAAGRRLLCCVAGSGIAAVRAVLHERAAARGTLAGVSLYYGVRTRSHVVFLDELTAFAAQGLAVRICLSGEAPAGPWDRAGWVQTVLAAEETDLSDAAILLAGPREMGPDVQDVATAAGMAAEMLLTNF